MVPGVTKNKLYSTFSVDPAENFYYRWLSFISLAVLYNVMMIIARSVFWKLQNSSPTMWYFFDYLCDGVYVIDMLIHARTGYLEDGLLVRDVSKLRVRYYTSLVFKVDIVSLVPTDIYYILLGNECHSTVPCVVIVRLNRLLRFYRMTEFFESTEIRTNSPFGLRIAKLIFYILVIIHWNACLYFATSYAIGFGTDRWVYRNVSVPPFGELSHQYIYCFYWSTLTLTTIGEIPGPESDVEIVFMTIDFLIGVLIFATIVGNVGSIITNMNAARTEFQNRMDNIKQHMRFRKVGKDLEERVIKWFNYLWVNKQSLDEEAITSVLPEKLQAEIAIRVHLNTLERVPLFQDCETGLLIHLALKLKLQVFSPNDYVCCKGDVGKEMYIVKRGILKVVGDDNDTAYATLREGSVFGELSILNISGLKTGNRRTANVRSVGFSDLFCLSKEDLWKVLEDYPEAEQMLVERGRKSLIRQGYLDKDTAKREEEKHRLRKDKLESLELSLEDLQERFVLLLTEYTEFQREFLHRMRKLENMMGI